MTNGTGRGHLTAERLTELVGAEAAQKLLA